ncbi:MAG: Flp pilus assembly complex ATPase component TadA [Firmicutes bacterium]|nr:Flp pilus assembly complex ATPase component TadA [Bacillota bacterium]
MKSAKRKRLGEILIDAGALTQEQLDKALELQRSSGRRLGEVLLKEGFITEQTLIQVLESQMGIQSLDLSRVNIDAKVARMIPESLARRHGVIPVHIAGGKLLLAMKDPLDYFAQEDVKTLVNLPVQPAIASERDIVRTIERVFSRNVAQKAVDDFTKMYGITHEARAETAATEAVDLDAAPIVRFLNTILDNAVRAGASDIHIEPVLDEMRVRQRIDGILQESLVTNMGAHPAIVSRVKVMSNLNVAEKRVPQDGRATYRVDNRDVDLRISVLPTTHGEKIVIRILDKSSFVIAKENLGMAEKDLEKFQRLISRPYGIILVTGPTGSGKSTTLYAMLTELNDVQKNIVTIEDPVEYNIKGITQTQVNVKTGYTFASGLRSILRQDPDIIMVGEIRDLETAEIAVRSALTGHLVLSTLHTNDAPGAVARLLDMGIEPFLLSSSLLGVIAQRLVRRICPSCLEEYESSEREWRFLGLKDSPGLKLYRGKGCPLCSGSGYRGRIGIFEIFELNKAQRHLIDKRANSDDLRDHARQDGMVTLWENCLEKVLKGITTVEEMVRVTYSY